MTAYDLTFIVDPLPSALQDQLLEDLDAIVGTTHGGAQYVTLTKVGIAAESAAKSAHLMLSDLGVRVRRLELDLVNRREIAVRLGVSRQTVGNWARGDRQVKGPRFPEPYNDVGGGVWLWGDIVEWIRALGFADPEPGLAFLTRADFEAVNHSVNEGSSMTPMSSSPQST